MEDEKKSKAAMMQSEVAQKQMQAASRGFLGFDNLYKAATGAFEPQVEMFNEAGTNELGFTDKLTVDPKKAGAVEQVGGAEDTGPGLMSKLGDAASAAGSKLKTMLSGDPKSSFANKKVRYLGK